MKPRTIVVAIVVAALAAGIWYWRSRGASERAPTTPEKPEKSTTSASKKTPPRPVEQPLQTQVEFALDDDPRGSLQLEGTVLDGQDIVVGGALVIVDSNPPRTVETETDGSFAFDGMLPRSYTLTARKDGLVGGPVVHELSSTSDPVAIRMQAGATLAVSVVDDTGAALVGANVEVRQDDTRQAITDRDGKARFVGVAGGFAVVVASAAGKGMSRQPVQIPNARDTTIEVRIELRQGTAVAGRVIDERGEPVVGARVLARAASALFQLGDGRNDGVVTDKRGAFELPALSAGSYRFVATHDDHAPSSSGVMALDGVTPVNDIQIVMKTGGILAGTVVDQNGAAVAHARVSVRVRAANNIALSTGAEARQSTADDRGAFRMTGLARSPISIMASSDAASSEVQKLDLSENPRAEEIILTLAISGTIAGRVVDSAGEPVAEAQVTALPDFFGGGLTEDFLLRGLAAETTDGGGQFKFSGLPEGTYQLRAARSKVSNVQFTRPGVNARTGDANVELMLDKPGGIKGTLQFKDGSAPTAFTVTITFPPGVPVANQTGDFLVEDIPPGKYDVTFRGANFAVHRVRDVEVAAGVPKDMGTIEIARGRSATGRVTDEYSNPVPDAKVIAAQQLFGDGKSVVVDIGGGASFGVLETTTGEDGSFILGGLGARELQVIAEHDQFGRSIAGTIPAGTADVTLELALQPLGSVTGTITVDGKPASGANVIASPRGGANQMLMVTAGADGSYAYERLARGPHRITASIGGGLLGAANSSGKDVEVLERRNVVVDIEVEVGDIALTVIIQGKDEAKIDAAQVFLMKGQHSPTTAKQLTEAFLQNQSGGIMQSFALGTDRVTFDKVIAAEYSVCVIPLNGDLSDPTFLARLQEKSNFLKVHCTVYNVAPTPKTQSTTSVVPAMEPLPEDDATTPGESSKGRPEAFRRGKGIR